MKGAELLQAGDAVPQIFTAIVDGHLQQKDTDFHTSPELVLSIRDDCSTGPYSPIHLSSETDCR
ncbi:hypothetical protein AMEX_G2453 [Astyanax mexicanus]|uniref:Uncharacterized protein n=1 Tax=Astyanax mexicanus TaxID=7994 RepID=A0A8T2MKI8_ASTMX|nr:hypothetical protein AMEX_G2453 [Astyanax mexicanus]